MAERFPWLGRMFRRGRRRLEPQRETEAYPRLIQLGQVRDAQNRPSFKPVARNLRYFSKTPYARRAINAIKNPIAQLDWEIVPIKGVKANREIDRQIETTAYCFENPNADDSFRSLIEQVTEDVLCGAGAIEVQVGADPLRPLWLWPVDGLSIQIFAGWDGDPNEARYFQANGYGGLGNLSTAGVQLRNDELIYLRPNPTTMDPFGVGPLEVAFLSISRQLGVAEFAGNVASNARPGVGLHFKGADASFLNAFRAFWRNEIEAQGQMPITGGPEEASVLRLYPDGDKALFLEWQQFLIREIATAFDLSPQNLGVDRDVNRNTSEVAEDRDWDHAIKPMAHLLQSHLTREAIHRRLGFHQLRFRFVGLDREDEKATAEIYQIYYKNNAITPNEQRERLGMEPMKNEWGDRTAADVTVAMEAARGMKTNFDKDLPPTGDQPAKKPAPRGNKMPPDPDDQE